MLKFLTETSFSSRYFFKNQHMASRTDTTVGEPSLSFDSLMPSRSDQRFIFSLLLDAIARCEANNSAAWSVTKLKHGFRLNIGQVEVLTVGCVILDTYPAVPEALANGITLRLMLAGSDCLQKVADRGDDLVEINQVDYKSVGEPNWSYCAVFVCSENEESTPSRNLVEDDTAQLQKNHFQYIDLACRTRTGAVRQRSNFIKSHCPAIEQYARHVKQGVALSAEAAAIVLKEQASRLMHSTEALAMVTRRLGQEAFRTRLMEYWGNQCCITGLAIPSLLRASHSKPWKDCEADSPERLDVYNGLLLAPHLDALYDAGYMTVMNDGSVVFADSLSVGERAKMALGETLRIDGLEAAHLPYLAYHRECVFLQGLSSATNYCS